MKPRLGDDPQDGSLLLGGDGIPSSTGSPSAQKLAVGGSLSARQTLAAVANSAAFSGSPSAGSGGGGGVRGPSYPIQQR